MSEAYYFGNDSDLFAIFHPHLARAKSHAVLICAPFFHEYFKAHQSCRKIAIELSARGYDVLRFDYCGTGDSLSSLEVATVDRWQSDIVAAAGELLDISAATKLSVLALRGSSLLLANLPLQVSRMVYWDPILDGSEYIRGLRTIHQDLVHSHRNVSNTQMKNLIHDEFLGENTNHNLLEQLSGLQISTPLPGLDDNLVMLSVGAMLSKKSPFVSQINTAIEHSDFSCHWERRNVEVLFAEPMVKTLLTRFS